MAALRATNAPVLASLLTSASAMRAARSVSKRRFTCWRWPVAGVHPAVGSKFIPHNGFAVAGNVNLADLRR